MQMYAAEYVAVYADVGRCRQMYAAEYVAVYADVGRCMQQSM